jgi:porin
MRFVRPLLLATALALGPAPAWAQAWWSELRDGYLPVPSISSSLPGEGDPGGVRKWLGQNGIVIGLEYTADVLSNVSGGTKIGTIYQGKLQGMVQADLAKLGLWDGLTLYSSFFQIHNTGRMRRDHVGGINTIAAIEGVPATRLSELWLEQGFFGGKLSLRAGQLAADNEFFYSELSTMFLQSDWATIAAANLPSSGSAYPLSTMGARLKIAPVEEVALLIALLNGDPAGPGPGDEQIRNPGGVNFRLGDAPFLIAELQVMVNNGPTAKGLAGTYKLGFWQHFGWFDDQRVANDGSLIADPGGSGVAARRHGNHGFYGVIDQQLYRRPGEDGEGGISVFMRASMSPPDRNLIDYYIDGGIIFAGLIPGRPRDRVGLSMMHASYSTGVRSFDRDSALFAGTNSVIRDYERNLEIGYRAEIVPGWTVQPTVQFVWHPSGDGARNALVIGMRSLLRY